MSRKYKVEPTVKEVLRKVLDGSNSTPGKEIYDVVGHEGTTRVTKIRIVRRKI